MDEYELWKQLEQHHAAGFGWARSCCAHSPELAEDVLQTTYLKILQGRARYDGRAAFRTWFFAVIRLTAADEERRRWMRRLRLIGYGEAQAGGMQSSEPGKDLDRSSTAEIFRRATASLPKRQREILHLVFYQDLSLQEASVVMGVSAGSARKHYDRAKRNFRTLLGHVVDLKEYGQPRERI